MLQRKSFQTVNDTFEILQFRMGSLEVLHNDILLCTAKSKQIITPKQKIILKNLLKFKEIDLLPKELNKLVDCDNIHE